jgi:tetratricopeptide (TPR) repeat protein
LINTKAKSLKQTYLNELKNMSTNFDFSKCKIKNYIALYTTEVLTSEFKNSSENLNNYTNALNDLKNFDFISAKSNIDKIEIDKLTPEDKAMMYKIKSQIYIETGNIKEAISFNNKSLHHFEKKLSQLDPILISTKLDNIEANLNLTNNISALRDTLTDEIAKAELINNKYLVTKGYNLLSNVCLKAGYDNTSLMLQKRTIHLYNQNKLNDEVLLMKIFTNGVIDTDSRSQGIKVTNPNIKYILRFNNLLNISEGSLYKNLQEVDSLINDLVKDNRSDVLLAKCYFMKFLIYENMKRDQVSDCYLEQAYDVLNKSYSPDSMVHNNFMNFVTFHTVNKKIKLYKLDKLISFTYDSLFKKGLLYPNYNSLMLNYYLILKNRHNIQEAMKHYSNFIRLHNSFVGKESELLFYLNMFLRYNKMPIYESIN